MRGRCHFSGTYGVEDAKSRRNQATVRRVSGGAAPPRGAMSETRPSIMYVITDLEVGGVPLHLHRLTLAMRDRGYRPSVVSLAPPGAVGERLQGDGIPVESCHACCGWDLRVIPRLSRRPDQKTIDAFSSIPNAERPRGTAFWNRVGSIPPRMSRSRWRGIFARFAKCSITDGELPIVR